MNCDLIKTRTHCYYIGKVYCISIMAVVCTVLHSNGTYWGEWWRSWLKHNAARREVPGSIPGRVFGNVQVTYYF